MSRRVILVSCAVLLAIAGVFVYINFHLSHSSLAGDANQALKSQVKVSRNLSHFDHVVIILEENKPEGTIIGNADAPYINSLAKSYALADNYYAVTNPSLPNYLALTSGSTDGISNDCNPPGGPCIANVTNIADRLEQAKYTWKEYAESMPQACYPNNSGRYAVKHNPFMYYPDITTNTVRCDSHVVPYTQLASDFTNVSSSPNYAFVTPNLCSDMHDCSVQTGDNWLAQQVPKILSSPAFTLQHSLLVITWDEGDNADNNVSAIFIGPAAKTSFTSHIAYSHYSLLHTIENNWNLQPLTANDKNAPSMTDMLK